MKCAFCGREIRGIDYIHVSTSGQNGIYVNSAPCEWYNFEGNTDDDV